MVPIYGQHQYLGSFNRGYQGLNQPVPYSGPESFTRGFQGLDNPPPAFIQHPDIGVITSGYRGLNQPVQYPGSESFSIGFQKLYNPAPVFMQHPNLGHFTSGYLGFYSPDSAFKQYPGGLTSGLQQQNQELHSFSRVFQGVYQPTPTFGQLPKIGSPYTGFQGLYQPRPAFVRHPELVSLYSGYQGLYQSVPAYSQYTNNVDITSGFQDPQQTFVPVEGLLFDPQLNTWFRAIPDFAPDSFQKFQPLPSYIFGPGFSSNSATNAPLNYPYIDGVAQNVDMQLEPIMNPPPESSYQSVIGDSVFDQPQGREEELNETVEKEGGRSTQDIDDGSNYDLRRMTDKNIEPAKSLVSSGVAKFARKMYSELLSSTNARDSNLVFSPYSLYSVLMMTMTGCSGKTLEELRGLLDVEEEPKILEDMAMTRNLLSNQTDDFVFASSNFIFVDETVTPLMPNFIQVNADTFNSTPTTVDFTQKQTSSKTINDAVKNATSGKIEDFIDPESMSGDTLIMLVNAVYLKANWMHPFRELPLDSDFHLLNGKTIQTKTMFQESHLSIAELPELKSRAVRLPYSGGSLSMVIILPDELDGLPEVEKSLQSFDLSAIKFGDIESVSISLPKFKLSSEMELKESLQRVGVTDLFGGANLERMTARKDLKVESVLHKSMFEVSENSTEAAAASAVQIVPRIASVPLYFTCDRPFMFYVEDGLTGLTLFIGRLVDPSRS